MWVGGVGERVPLPVAMTEGSAGLDLHAAIEQDLILEPMRRLLVPTGLAVELPDGYAAEIRPRSGLAVQEGVTLLNTPGTVDQDYRGEIQVVLINLGSRPVTIRRGERIAQLVVHRVYRIRWEKATSLRVTRRGQGGFGSTGRGGIGD